jgi:hypothetical protein
VRTKRPISGGSTPSALICVIQPDTAIAWLRQQALRHTFVDVGCMQVDLHYHPDAFNTLDEALDPAANADYAARLLVDLYRGEAGGSWDIAVGLHHSHRSLLAAEY